MVDEIVDRAYQAGRADLNAGLDRAFGRLGGTLARSLQVLHRIEWSAPWNGNSKNTQCG
jgi:hypothetical protein